MFECCYSYCFYDVLDGGDVIYIVDIGVMWKGGVWVVDLNLYVFGL